MPRLVPGLSAGCCLGLLAAVGQEWLKEPLLDPQVIQLALTALFLASANFGALLQSTGRRAVGFAMVVALGVYGTLRLLPLEPRQLSLEVSVVIGSGLLLGALLDALLSGSRSSQSSAASEIPASIEEAVWVILPTLNEAASIRSLLTQLRAAVPNAHLLVVDDHSQDGTAAVAREVAGALGKVEVLVRESDRGLAGAWLAGFRYALARGAQVVVTMDADGSHDPEQLPDLLRAVQSADLAIGSRYIPGARILHWPLRRHLLSRLANSYVRYALDLSTRDCTSGFRAYRAAALQGLLQQDLDEVSGYVLLEVLLFYAWVQGLHIQEVPITFRERDCGSSKLHWREVWLGSRLLWRLNRDAPARVPAVLVQS